MIFLVTYGTLVNASIEISLSSIPLLTSIHLVVSIVIGTMCLGAEIVQ